MGDGLQAELGSAVAMRRRDPALTADERERLDAAARLVVGPKHRPADEPRGSAAGD